MVQKTEKVDEGTEKKETPTPAKCPRGRHVSTSRDTRSGEPMSNEDDEEITVEDIMRILHPSLKKGSEEYEKVAGKICLADLLARATQFDEDGAPIPITSATLRKVYAHPTRVKEKKKGGHSNEATAK